MDDNKKPICGFEGLYDIDEYGNVYSYKSNRNLKPNIISNGYIQYYLCKDKKRYCLLAHRLVAMTFIPNPHNYPIVNHKDENKVNNYVGNLEWCSYKYNSNYGSLPKKASERNSGVENNPGGKAVRKPCEQLTKNGDHIEYFKSVSDAHRKTGINLANIALCCKNQRLTAGKYKWKYIEEESTC